MGKRQQKLIENEPKHDDAVSEAAEAYVEIRDERMEMTAKEVKARDHLLFLMKDRGLTTYDDGDLKVEVDVTEKVKVKKAGAGGDDEAGEE